MSRRAIISDIHGNLVALEAVLEDIKQQGVDQIVCLGDICGYGPQPIECINLIRKTCAWSLLGNHDEALFVEPRPDFGRNALLAIGWQRKIMEPGANPAPDVQERWNWLKNLPVMRQEKDVLFVHASPRDPTFEYVLKEDFQDSGLGPTQKAKDIFAAMEWLCFCGHSHRPGVVAEDYHWHLPSELEGGASVIRRGFKTIVNIGSVGQPRDENPAACYVIFDYTPLEEHKTAPVNPTKAGSGTMVMVKDPPSQKTEVPSAANDETRFGEELKAARDTALLKMPRVVFRRVKYDIDEAQRRFRAVPELPENNALRLASGR